MNRIRKRSCGLGWLLASPRRQLAAQIAMRWNGNGQGGLTLVELIVVLVIIGVLAAIGYPSYQNFVRESKRTDAHVLLDRIASAQERYYSDNNAYTPDLTQLGMANPQPSDEGFWQAAVSVGSGGFTITATAAGRHGDDVCGCIILTSLGERRSTAGACSAALNPPGTCW